MYASAPQASAIFGQPRSLRPSTSPRGESNVARAGMSESTPIVTHVDALVERAKRGDPAAFRQLFDRHKNEVSRLVYRLLGRSSSDLEDVVQDVFVHVYRSLKGFRGDAKFSTWLYRLTVNVVRMHIRKAKSRPRVADGVEVPERTSQPRIDLDPEASLQRRRRMEAFESLIATLSEKKRAVLVMHDIEGMSAKDIAEIVGAPVLTVRTRLFYARKELYDAIAGNPALRGALDDVLRAMSTERSHDSRTDTRKSDVPALEERLTPPPTDP